MLTAKWETCDAQGQFISVDRLQVTYLRCEVQTSNVDDLARRWVSELSAKPATPTRNLRCFQSPHRQDWGNRLNIREWYFVDYDQR